MPHLPDPVLFAIPGFVLLVTLEMVYGRATGRARFEPRDSFTSLVMGLGSVAFPAAVAFIVVGWFTFVSRFALFDIGVAAWSIVLAFILDDFVYYWSHRAAHRIRWFWADHVIHHSSQHYNLTTALRQPWFGLVTLKFVFFGSWLVWLGFPPTLVAFVGGLNLIYQFWIHTETIGRLPGWFEAVMNTPSHHRVHHATNPRYLDANYAGVFIIWDRLFGTFVPEQDDDACRYGVVHNLATFNPLKVATHEYVAIARDVSHATSIGEAVSYVVRPPGWSPDGSRDTTDMIKARWREHALSSPADGGPER